MLLNHHQYAAIYRHAYDILEHYDLNDDVSICLHVAPGHDHRWYNLPTADEVAVILPGVAGGNKQLCQCDIVLQTRAGELQVINVLHPAYVPLYYVLLFPYGENGWHPALNLRSHDSGGMVAKRLTKTRYVTYRLQVWENEYSALLQGGCLLQQFMVDMFACIDQSWLYWFRQNQSSIRACLYSGLEDAVGHGDDDVDLHTLGQRFILPLSYIGGATSLAAALSRFNGNCTLFSTCGHIFNNDYKSTVAVLLPRQTAYDRPKLVSRIFQMKKKAIIDFIHKHGIFGIALAYVYSIEFQKRGLPHIHMLIFLKEPYKLNTMEAIDSCIWGVLYPPPRIPPGSGWNLSGFRVEW